MPRGPALGESVSILVKVPPEMAEAIDDRRRQADDLPSRPELVRRLLAESLGVDWSGGKG